MKHLSFLLLTIFVGFQSQAKVWRLNNNPGVAADFTSFYDAMIAATVVAGDTIYLEPSVTEYATNSSTLDKRLVVIGAGYFLDPANATYPANPGLQVAKTDSKLAFMYIGSGASGSKFLGVNSTGGFYINGASNLSFERVLINGSFYFVDGAINNLSIRKSILNGISVSASGTATATNFICENSIFINGTNFNLTILTGSGNIVRNNSGIGLNTFTLRNTYFVNNIIGCGSSSDLTDCTIKNNIFQAAQTLPGTATANLINQDMDAVFVGGTANSVDSRYVLKAASPAKAAGLTVGSVVNPDCGAFGGTDPYRISGIPNIPTIYSLTVPASIASGTATMNITFSSKNNN